MDLLAHGLRYLPEHRYDHEPCRPRKLDTNLDSSPKYTRHLVLSRKLDGGKMPAGSVGGSARDWFL